MFLIGEGSWNCPFNCKMCKEIVSRSGQRASSKGRLTPHETLADAGNLGVDLARYGAERWFTELIGLGGEG